MKKHEQTIRKDNVCSCKGEGEYLEERTEMRMLGWTMGIKTIGQIRTEEIRSKASVATSQVKIREERLRWLERQASR